MTHELKTWPEAFRDIKLGSKKHEIRKADRNFNVGDTLHLREWDPFKTEYTGETVDVTVTYITREGLWGLPADICVMSVSLGLE